MFFNGKYPLFDRSNKIKKSNNYIYDGKFTIIPGEGIFKPKYYDGKFNLHQRAYAVSSDVFLPKYLFYLLIKKQKIFYKYAVGSTVPSLRSSSFTWLNKEILLTFKEQQEIIDIIEPIEIMENKLNKIIKNWNIQIKNLPKNKKCKLKDISKEIKIKPKGIRQISAKILNKRNPIIKKLETKNTYKTNTFFINAGSIVINTIRPYLEKFAISPKDADANGTLLQLDIDDKNYSSIISNLLNDAFWKKINLLSKGTKMPIVSKKDILNIDIQKTKSIIELKRFYLIIFKMLILLNEIKMNKLKLLIK